MRGFLVLLAVVGVVARADFLVLTDGTLWCGRVQGLTSTHLGFLSAGGLRWIPLEEVQKVRVDLRMDSRPRVDRRIWSRALDQALRELWTCRHFQEGLTLAGLLFLAAGQWLVNLGHRPFGELLTALGALGIFYGLGTPPPGCRIPAARLRTLLNLGLEHGWLLSSPRL